VCVCARVVGATSPSSLVSVLVNGPAGVVVAAVVVAMVVVVVVVTAAMAGGGKGEEEEQEDDDEGVEMGNAPCVCVCVVCAT
jgi:mannitol-specific phosphotransferase system IIBC component